MPAETAELPLLVAPPLAVDVTTDWEVALVHGAEFIEADDASAT